MRMLAMRTLRGAVVWADWAGSNMGARSQGAKGLSLWGPLMSTSWLLGGAGAIDRGRPGNAGAIDRGRKKIDPAGTGCPIPQQYIK